MVTVTLRTVMIWHVREMKTGGRTMQHRKVFWIFGTLQSLSLGSLVQVVLRGMNTMSGSTIVGWDTRLVLSITFPLFLLLVEYMIYSRDRVGG